MQRMKLLKRVKFFLFFRHITALFSKNIYLWFQYIAYWFWRVYCNVETVLLPSVSFCPTLYYYMMTEKIIHGFVFPKVQLKIKFFGYFSVIFHLLWKYFFTPCDTDSCFVLCGRNEVIAVVFPQYSITCVK